MLPSLRKILVWAITISGIFIWLLVEILSLFEQLTFLPVFCLLNAVLLGLACWIFLHYNKKKSFPHIKFPRLNNKEFILLFIIISIMSIQFITAISCVPNEGDSLGYRMTRVMHWIQNKSLVPFTTEMLRQNTYPPFAEYHVLLLQIFTNSDRLANLVQWFYALGTLMISSLIAVQLGLNRLGQLLTCALIVTLPMGISQSATTQNDYVASFWIMAGIYFLFKLRTTHQLPDAIGVGIAVGLAFLTKGTSYFLLIPFLLITLISLTKSNIQRAVTYSFIITLIALAINMPHATRLKEINQTPLSTSQNLRNQDLGIKPLLLNLSRNIGMLLVTPLKEINQFTFNTITHINQQLGLDANDPRYTYPEKSYKTQHLAFDDRYAMNPLHLLLILITTISLLVFHRRNTGETIIYLVGTCLAILLFNLILKWQPFHARFHLPFFIAFMPLCALWLCRFPKTMLSICLILFIYAIPFIVFNYQRPLLGPITIFNTPKDNQYFIKNNAMTIEYQTAAQIITSQHCKAIGIYGHDKAREYPLWALLKKPLDYSTRIENIIIDGTPKYPLGPFTPCLIADFKLTSKSIILNKIKYTPILEQKHLNLFAPETTTNNYAKQ